MTARRLSAADGFVIQGDEADDRADIDLSSLAGGAVTVSQLIGFDPVALAAFG